jgi:hypothetical protein
MRRSARSIRTRGLGPFTGGQLTIVVVAIAAMFALPTAALAAAGAFSNNSATTPAVKGTNANANGIGAQGSGKKYGVYSDGPLGVAAGKSLKCTGCVGPSAIASGARSLANAYSKSGSADLSAVGESPIASVHVPAGNYLVNWSASFWASATVANGVCYIDLGDVPPTPVDMVETGLAAAFPPGVLRGAASSTNTHEGVKAGNVTLHCFANQVTHVAGTLTLLKVGAVGH